MYNRAKSSVDGVRPNMAPDKAKKLDRALADLERARKEENRAAFALASAEASMALTEARTEVRRDEQVAADRFLNATRRYAALAQATPLDKEALRVTAAEAEAQWRLAAPGLPSTSVPNGLQAGLTEMRQAAARGDRQAALQAADILLPIAAKVDRDLNPPPMATTTTTPTPR